MKSSTPVTLVRAVRKMYVDNGIRRAYKVVIYSRGNVLLYFSSVRPDVRFDRQTQNINYYYTSVSRGLTQWVCTYVCLLEIITRGLSS